MYHHFILFFFLISLSYSGVQDIHYKEADEDEGGNWHHVIANSTRKTSGEKEVVDEDLRAILEDLVLVTDFLPELVNSEVAIFQCRSSLEFAILVTTAR